ncbi:unnamed protein product [Cladocopium goreaui]|uniref:Hypoxia-inducible factor prolyl hydroxylase (HIF-PH) (Egg-laying defective protein 9 ) (Hypoxia-inducible factor-proline dioxygenase) n=1 Tax=Cladocopium goreaui TaxID=2562237 RepID=A0A9P1D3M4_9DINO|nr:unnamed protein product [Cladocopium goreaui]
MQGGFLDKAISKEKAERVKVKEAGKHEWDEGTIDSTVKIFQEILNDRNKRAKQDLERRVRSGTGVREFRGKCCGAADDPVPESEQDIAYRLIEDFTKPSALRDAAGPIMEWAQEIFGNVKRKGAQSGQTMDTETEIQVMRDVVKECLIRYVVKQINTENSEAFAANSHDAGLLATPQGYTIGDLESLDVDCVKGLMEQGYGIQENFLKDDLVNDVYRELEMIDFDGKLSIVQQQKMAGIRSDKICWVNYEGLEREKQPGLLELFKKMISIPFELNKKCSLYLQASGSFQLASYPKEAFYKKHMDGGYDSKLNNGRKVTAIFYANKDWTSSDGGQLRLYKQRPNPFQLEKGATEPNEDEMEHDIDPVGGRLVLFRSRDIPHEVLPTGRKRFAVSLWLPGPAGKRKQRPTAPKQQDKMDGSTGGVVGEMLKGTRATYGLEPRCVEVTATVTNPEDRVLKKAGVFGKVNNGEEVTSVLANAMDGASDNGQFTLVEEIPPGTNDINFRFVAALPKRYNNKDLPQLEFYQLKATWYPGAVRWQPLTACDLNPTADGCEDAERFCKNCKNNMSDDGKPIFN